MGIDQWEWEGMGILIVFPHTSTWENRHTDGQTQRRRQENSSGGQALAWRGATLPLPSPILLLPVPPSLFPPLPFRTFLFPSLPFLSLPLPLEVGPLKSS